MLSKYKKVEISTVIDLVSLSTINMKQRKYHISVFSTLPRILLRLLAKGRLIIDRH